MRRTRKCRLISAAMVSLFVTMMSSVPTVVVAKPGQFFHEWEESWSTYDRSIASSVYAENINWHGGIDIAVGGIAVDMQQPLEYGQLRVGSKDWCSLDWDQSAEWTSDTGEDAGVTDVHIANVDEDPTIEIVTVGYEKIQGDTYGEVRVWIWDYSHLMLEGQVYWAPSGYSDTWFHSVTVADVDHNGKPEVVVAGLTMDVSGNKYGLLTAWKFYPITPVEPLAYVVWQSGGDTEPKGIAVADFNQDLVEDVVTVGSATQSSVNKVEVDIWRFVPYTFILQGQTHWIPSGYVSANATSVELWPPVPGEPFVPPDIYVAGSAFSTEHEGMVSVWDWNGPSQPPALLAHTEWEGVGDHAMAEGVSVFDVDQDNDVEIVTAGIVGKGQAIYGQLAIWRQEGGNIVEDDPGSSIEWLHSGASTTRAMDLHIWDVDPDIEIEIITVGSRFDPLPQNEHAILDMWTWNSPSRTPKTSNDWIEMCPDPHPHRRAFYAMAYDGANDKAVLVGGEASGFPDSNEVWSYDFELDFWEERSEFPFCAGHHRGVMAYDAESDRSILFSGYPCNKHLYPSQTFAYRYSTDTWEYMTPSEYPHWVTGSAMVYTGLAHDEMVLFGGNPGTGGYSDETWVYDYNSDSWTDMTQLASPSQRAYHSMAYDSQSDRIVLFGGFEAQGTYLDDTWTYNPNTNEWSQLHPPSPRPGPRDGHWMTYDEVNDLIVLFGGADCSGGMCQFLGETWVFDLDYGSDGKWTRMYPPHHPKPGVGMKMVYDQTSEVIVLFGGYSSWYTDGYSDKTWVYKYA